MVKLPNCANAATVKIALTKGELKIELYVYSDKFHSVTFIWQC